MKKAKIHHSFAWSAFNFKQRVVAIISLLAGNRDTGGTFANLGTNANFWSSSQSGTSAWNRNLNSGNPTVNRNLNSKANGFSVRCLSIEKNASSPQGEEPG